MRQRMGTAAVQGRQDGQACLEMGGLQQTAAIPFPLTLMGRGTCTWQAAAGSKQHAAGRQRQQSCAHLSRITLRYARTPSSVVCCPISSSKLPPSSA
jgi:hypothetical protein